MLTLVGRDEPGIVARISRVLYEAECDLGEASMTRLGGNFTIMLMVRYGAEQGRLDDLIGTECRELGLKWHLDSIEGELHRHIEPNVRVSVHASDRPGIVFAVTSALAREGFNILNLESDVGGTAEKPVYVMHIEGTAPCDPEELRKLLEDLSHQQGFDIHVSPIDVLLG